MATKFISTISDTDFKKSNEAGRRIVARGPLAVGRWPLRLAMLKNAFV